MPAAVLQLADGEASTGRARLDIQVVLRLTILTLCITSVFNVSASSELRRTPILLNDVGVVLLVFTAALLAVRTRSLRLNDVCLAALLFAAIGGISAMTAITRFDLSVMEVVLSLAYLARWLMYLGVYVVVINWVRGTGADRVYGTLEGVILLFAGFGIFQSFFIPDFGQLVYPDARLYRELDPQGDRLVSTALDPNLAAAMIMMILLVQVARISSGAKVALWKPAMLFVAMLLTVSRSGNLSLVVGIGFIVVLGGLPKRLGKFFVPALVLLLAMVPRLITMGEQYKRFSITDGSANSRVVGWLRAIGTFLDHPWIGVGFNTYGFVQQRRGVDLLGTGSYSVDGGLLFIAVMTGIVGVVAYAIMLWLVVRHCRKTLQMPEATPEQRGLALGVAAVTVAMVVDSAFVNSLLTSYVMLPLWVLWGLAFVTNRDIAWAARRQP